MLLTTRPLLACGAKVGDSKGIRLQRLPASGRDHIGEQWRHTCALTVSHDMYCWGPDPRRHTDPDLEAGDVRPRRIMSGDSDLSTLVWDRDLSHASSRASAGRFSGREDIDATFY